MSFSFLYDTWMSCNHFDFFYYEICHIIEFGGMEIGISRTNNFIFNKGKNYFLFLLLLDL